MAEPIVYRSTHPDVLAHWEKTASAQAQEAWRGRVEDTLAGLGFPGRQFATRDGMTGLTVTGVEHPRSEPVPPGWRRDQKLPSTITPRRSIKAGKAAAAALDELTRPDPRKDMPGGMPPIAGAAGAMAFLRAAIEPLDGAVYVRWPQEISVRDAACIDPTVWERVRLSEYYAACERQDAEQDGDDRG